MYPVLFKIGRFELHSYGVMLAAAFAVSVFLAVKRGQKVGFTFSQIYDITIVVIFSSLIGSRMAYVVLHFDEFRGRMWDIINPIQSNGQIGISGMVQLGGVVFAIAAVIIYVRIKSLSLGKVSDVLTPSLAIGIAIGRIGCFLNGCCFGKPCDLPWAIKFPPGSFAHYAYNDTAVHPTQLYAVFYALLIFIILTIVDKKKPFHGFNLALFMILYGIARYINESLRYYEGSESGMVLIKIFEVGITFSQIISIALVLAGLIIIITRTRSFSFGKEK